MRLLNPASAIRTAVRALDTSEGGLKLRVAQALKPGTLIQVRLKGAIALAEVRYCRKAGAEFHVGVQLQDVFSKGGGTSRK